MSDNANAVEARKYQQFYGDAVKCCMERNCGEFKRQINSFMDAHPSITPEVLFSDFQSQGKTLMHVAASSGKIDIGRFVVSLFENPKKLSKMVNLADEHGFTPLINATISESSELMTLFLSKGADVNTRNKDGSSAIHFAAGDGSVERVKLLHTFTPPKGSLYSPTDLMLTSQAGTPLHWAAGHGHSDVCRYLIAEGNVDINVKNEQGLTAMGLAACSNKDSCVKALVVSGGDVTVVFGHDLTALHLCAEHGLIESVKSMLDLMVPSGTCGVRSLLSMKTIDGHTPLYLAAMSGHRNIVELLLPHSDDLSLSMDSVMEEGSKRMKAWELAHAPPTPSPPAASTTTTSTAPPPAPQDGDRLPLIGNLHPTDQDIAKATVLKNLGNTHFVGQKYSEADDVYSQAIELQGTNAVLYSNRSACRLAMGRNEEALQDAIVCRHLDPSWFKGCFRLAKARLAMKLYEDAAVAAFEGCKLNEKNEELKELLREAVRLGQVEHQANEKMKNKT